MPTPTASQTIGPFWHLIDDPSWADLTRFGAEGEVITLVGLITDGNGDTIADAAVEIWQSSPASSESFPGYGRCRTDTTGTFRFKTIKPGTVPGLGNSLQAPHIAMTLFARGILTQLRTRVYFAGEPTNDADPVLSLIEDAAQRATLIARETSPSTWRLDISLQGDNETVFMEV